MSGTYQIWLYDPFGNNRILLEGWTHLQYTRTVNDACALTLIVPAILSPDLFMEDGRLWVMRSVNGGSFVLETETPWFIRYFRAYRENGVLLYEIRAVAAVGLLATRIITSASGTTYAQKTDNADDMIKAICREALGPLVLDSSRSLATYMTIQADKALAPSITKDFSHANVLQTCQEIAQASADHDTTPTPLFFDVTQVGSGLVLRTYTGQRGNDHTAGSGNPAVVLSEERGNLVSPSLEYDYSSEVTYVYAGGQGSGDAQLVGSAYDSVRIKYSPFNRREAWASNTNATTLASCNYEAATALRKGRPLITFTGTIQSTPDTEYGVHWGWGDKLTASFMGRQLNVRADTVSVTVDGQNEQIEAKLKYSI